MTSLLRRARAGFAFAALVVGSVAWAPEVHACACCSDPGERDESVQKLEGHTKDELRLVRFGSRARVYMTAAGNEGIAGITDPEARYDLAVSQRGDQWTFTLTSSKKARGQLTFTLPASFTSFAVDKQDGPPNTDPVLYKEWRLEAPVTSSGSFAPATTGAPATARLVLQGKGNSCTSAGDFTHWMLTVKGPRADFRLFGPLAPPAASPTP